MFGGENFQHSVQPSTRNQTTCKIKKENITKKINKKRIHTKHETYREKQHEVHRDLIENDTLAQHNPNTYVQDRLNSHRLKHID